MHWNTGLLNHRRNATFSGLLNRQNSSKQPLSIGWRLVYKSVDRAITCWTCLSTERTSIIYTWIITSIWSLLKRSQPKKERSLGLEMVSYQVMFKTQIVTLISINLTALYQFGKIKSDLCFNRNSANKTFYTMQNVF